MAKKYTKTGGVTAPTGKAKGKRAAVQAAKPMGPQKVMGMGSLSNQEVKDRFKKRFQKLDKNARHALVQKVMAKRFGKSNYREKVYGKKFTKEGGFKHLNKEVKQDRTRAKRSAMYLREAKQNLGNVGTGANASANTSKIQERIKELEANRKKAVATLGSSKETRQKFLDLRNKTLGNIQATATNNPKALAAARKNLIKNEIEKKKKEAEKKKS